jgi:hypothetical protein
MIKMWTIECSHQGLLRMGMPIAGREESLYLPLANT